MGRGEVRGHIMAAARLQLVIILVLEDSRKTLMVEITLLIKYYTITHQQLKE